MFGKARIKLTIYYLVIIMVISLFFSSFIYRGATLELKRIENLQRLRRPNPVFILDPDIIKETRSRIALSLVFLNGVILAVSGLAGFFLSGKTLNPIQKMHDEQKEFIGNASHELRTPLTSLKTEMEVALRNKTLTINDAKQLIKSNLEDVNTMVKLSDYLLKLNKFQNYLKTDYKKINLAKVTKDVLGKRKVTQKLNKTFVMGDYNMLFELISIFVDNAFKYSSGNPKIEVITLNKTFIIKDNGIGISKADLPHIFERFYRGDKSRTKNGYGLGLSIAKQIADNLKAKIEVTSKLEQGSTFKVIFS